MNYKMHSGIKRFDTGGSTGPYQVNIDATPSTGVAPTKETTTDVGLPAYSAPYIQQLFQNTAGLASTPFQQYGGQITAGYNPLLNKGFEAVRGMETSPYLDKAATMAGQGASNQFTGANVSQYMSPYMQNVVNQQQASAVRDYARNIPGMGANAARVGGLGGTRNALVQAEGQRNLQNTLAGIQATGSQNAFQNAQQQFNQQQANLMQGAGIMSGIGQAQYGQQAGIANALLGSGAVARDIEQQGLTGAYNQYLTAQEFPYKQLQFANDMYRGYPGSSTTQTIYGQAPSPMQTMASIYGGLGSFFGNTGGSGTGQNRG